MNTIAQVISSIEVKQKELSGVRSGIERCEACIATANEASENLAALKQQRKDALTAAFMDGKAADTATIDAAIAKAEKGAAGTADMATGAAGAQAVLEERREQLAAELSDLEQQLHFAVCGECESVFREAEREYAEAVEVLGAAVVKLIGSQRAYHKFLPATIYLPVERNLNHQMRRYLDGFHISGGPNADFQSPLWVRQRDELADKQARIILDKLRSAGVEC